MIDALKNKNRRPTNISKRLNLPKKQVNDYLKSKEKKEQKSSYVKITFQPPTSFGKKLGIRFTGNILTKIVPDTQAEEKGIRLGWFIYEVNGVKQENDTIAIDKAIERTKHKSQTEITFLTKRENVKKIFFHPPKRNGKKLGIRFDGNKITKVVPDSQAKELGICVGWIIYEVNGEKQPNESCFIDRAIEVTKHTSKTEISFLTGDRRKSDFTVWLGRIGLDKYTDKFRKMKYNDLQFLKGTTQDEIKDIIEEIGIEGKEALVMKRAIKALKVHWTTEEMSRDWQPRPNEDLNLTVVFKDNDGNCSVQKSVQKITNGEINPEKNDFYVFSTSHQTYFRIKVSHQ